jgi:hypothetical protein
MRITFPRLPDHSRGYAFLERDDGVTYRLWGGPVSAHLPHDLVHFTVEDALGIGDGIWASIASGVVFRSMVHMGGRRPPHAEEQSDRLVKAHRPELGRAEMLGGLVERIAEVDQLDAATVRRLSTRWLSTLAPQDRSLTRLYQVDGQVDATRILAAVDQLRRDRAEWEALPVGAELVRVWPAHRRLPPLPRRPRRVAAGRRAPGHH